MGTRIYIREDEFNLSRHLTDAEQSHIETIENGWGNQAFLVDGDGYITFYSSKLEGMDPFRDGIEKPLKELLSYLEASDIKVNGTVFINGDSENYYDNMVLNINADYTFEYIAQLLFDMDDKTLIDELKRRGYEEPVKRRNIENDEKEL